MNVGDSVTMYGVLVAGVCVLKLKKKNEKEIEEFLDVFLQKILWMTS